MKEPIWSDPFAPMPASFERRLNEALIKAEATKMKKKYKYRASLAFALVLVIALGAAAFAAAQSGVLDFLFKGQTLSQEAQQLLVEPGNAVEENGVRLTLDGYVNDGATVSLAYTVESTLDTPVIIGTGAAFGYEATADRELDAFHTLHLLGDASNHSSPKSRQFEARYNLPSEFDGLPVPVKLYAQAYSTDRKLVWTEAGEHAGELFGDDGSVLVNWSGDFVPSMDGDAEEVRAWMKKGDIKDHASLTLDTAIQPTVGAQRTRVVGQTLFEFPGYTLSIDRLDFTATAVFFDVTMRAPANERYGRAAADDMGPFSRRYVLLDVDGNELIHGTHEADSEWLLNMFNEPPDGVHAQSINRFEQPFVSIPEAVTIMPVRLWTPDFGGMTDKAYSARRREHFIPEEAITVQLERFDSREIPHTRPDGQTVFELADRTVTVKTLDFLKDQTVCVWEIVYDKPLNYDAQRFIEDSYVLILPDGMELLRRNAEGRLGYGVSALHSTLTDGRDKLTFYADFDPLSEIPTQVTLMPIQYPFKHPYINGGKSGEDGEFAERTLEEDNAIYRKYFKHDEAITVRIAKQ